MLLFTVEGGGDCSGKGNTSGGFLWEMNVIDFWVSISNKVR